MSDWDEPASWVVLLSQGVVAIASLLLIILWLMGRIGGEYL